MKLLFDENLAPRLVRTLHDVFPGSTHASMLGLARATDREIWDRAAEEGFLIVTKDSDFQQLSFLLGAPPKVVWLRLGNCTVGQTESVLRASAHRIGQFAADPDAAYLILS